MGNGYEGLRSRLSACRRECKKTRRSGLCTGEVESGQDLLRGPSVGSHGSYLPDEYRTTFPFKKTASSTQCGGAGLARMSAVPGQRPIVSGDPRRRATQSSMNYSHETSLIATVIALQIGLIAIGFAIEHLRPVRPPVLGHLRLNVMHLLPTAVVQAFVSPVLGASVTSLVNSAGGGLLVLPASGAGLLFGIVLFTVAMDAAEYAFHRAQHRYPMLWAMHSLHHSETDMNVSTTQRHFWAEQLLKTVTVYVVVGLLFRANPTILAFYAAFTVYNFFLHMNVRIGFGRWSGWLNSPQYHRVHHSCREEHLNCNFAALFPVFDLLFRTYRSVPADDYPPTGLGSHEQPRNLLDMCLWPWRRKVDERSKSAPLTTPLQMGECARLNSNGS